MSNGVETNGHDDPEVREEEDRGHCVTHGNIPVGQFTAVAGDDGYEFEFCPFCFGEWVQQKFPVQRE